MNLRDAAVLGLVGAGGIGAPLIFAMNSYRWQEVGSILIGLVFLILIVEFISNKIRAKLINRIKNDLFFMKLTKGKEGTYSY